MEKNEQLINETTTIHFRKYYLILAALVFIVFGNTLFNGYNMDDHLVTLNHVYTSKGISAIKDILTSNYYSNNADINFGYRPIVHISFAIEHQIFGEHASISHFINLLLYLITVWIFFKLCVMWFSPKNTDAALLASLLFAVHPLHSETVASIKNRDEILALFWGLVSIYTITKHSANLALKWIVFSIISFTLGMLSKTSIYPLAIILPSTMLLLGKITFKKSLLVTFLLAIPAAAIGSDLQIYMGCILMIFPFLGLMFTYFYINYSNYINKIRKYFSVVSMETKLSVLSLSIFTLGFVLKEITIIALSIVLIVLTLKSKRPLGLLIIALQITLIAFLYNTKEFHKYAIIFSIAYIFQIVGFQQRKKTDYFFLILAILPLLSFFAINKSFKSATILLEIIPFFLFLNRKAIWGLTFIIISFTTTLLIHQASVYQYLLIGYAIIKVINELNLLKKFKFEKPVIKISISIIAVILVFIGHVHSPISQKIIQQYERFHTEYLNNKEIKTTDQGRKVNFIENTLSGQYTRAELLATGFSTISEYIRLTIYPAQLSFYYGYARIKTVNFSDKTAWLGLLIYVSLVAIALWQIKKNILISIGIAWYLLSISLFSNWIEPVAGMVGERLAYTASVGFCLAFAAFVLWLKPNFSLRKPKGMELVIIVILGLLSLRSISRNNDWMDPITLMEHDIEHLENSAQAHNLLALNLMYVSSSNKNLNPQQVLEMQNKAAFHLQKSTTIYPHFFNTNFDLARIYITLGNLPKAKEALLQALKIEPSNLFALEEMAKTCYELKLVEETESYANKYLAQIPQNENMHEILIYNMLVNSKYESAIYYAERAMSYYPNNQIIQKMYKDAQNMLGVSKPKNQ
jgi:tetratricopeptide (TPR) repeat protein